MITHPLAKIALYYGTRAFIYLVPGAEYPSREHEQVTHGDQTGPYQEREEAEHPLEDRLDADEYEDGQEEEEGGGNRDQERQVVLYVLGAEREREGLNQASGSR